MGDDTCTWRARIGTYQHKARKKKMAPSGWSCAKDINYTCKRRKTKMAPSGNKDNNHTPRPETAPRHKMATGTSSSSGRQVASLVIRITLALLLVVSMSVELNPGPGPGSPGEIKNAPSTSARLSPGGAKLKLARQLSHSPLKKKRTQSPMTTRRSRTQSPLKTRRTSTQLVYPVTPEKFNKSGWSFRENKLLITFIHHKNPKPGSQKWPMVKKEHPVWKEAVQHLHRIMGGLPRRATQVRSQLTVTIKNQFATIPPALTYYGIVASTGTHQELPDISELNDDSKVALALQVIESLSKPELHLKSFTRLFAQQRSTDTLAELGDVLFYELCQKKSIGNNIADFVSISSNAMVVLQQIGKPNLMHKFAQCITLKRPGSDDTLMPLLRMPFGLIQYQIEFYTTVFTTKVKMPHDYQEWVNMMEVEFGTRFNKLFRGPGWSGYDQSLWNQSSSARMNVACVNHVTITKNMKKEPFTPSPDIQIDVLKSMHDKNPKGRWWIKLDGTDIKPALQESVKGVWNGDSDLQDGILQELRATYDRRRKDIDEWNVSTMMDDLHLDIEFMQNHLQKTVKKFKEKYDRDNVADAKLKNINWDILEASELLTLAQKHMSQISQNGEQPTDIKSEMKSYLRDVFKKRRQPAATHVLVIMVSDEERKQKPYAQPVQYVPYHSIKDENLRQLTDSVKKEMVKLGMNCVGTVTDGEFSTLRTKGTGREVHLYEVIRKVRASVGKLTDHKMEEMLYTDEADSDNIIPLAVREKLQRLEREGKSRLEALQAVRQDLVPAGYEPEPWRKHVPEDENDAMKSIIATYKFRHRLRILKEEFDADFTKSIYIPEVDNVTNNIHHHREDHNHMLKRIAKHLREGGVPNVNLKHFDLAVKSKDTPLTHTALVGHRKQNVHDAEVLLSSAVAKLFRSKGFTNEAQFIQTVADWHEASDGRGMTQLERAKANQAMLDMLLDHWMPWHQENGDLSQLDINVRLHGLCGFSRESVIAVTTNICSQELRRLQNELIGYPEHPRAGNTDDVECFFSMLHHKTRGQNCTLQEFKHWWVKLVRQFIKRIDPDLPYYYWTASDRYNLDDLPSFDYIPAGSSRHHQRLHRLPRRRREDSSVIVSGRSFLPVQHQQKIRRRLFASALELPPVSENMQQQIKEVLDADFVVE